MVDLSLDLDKTSPTYLDLKFVNGDLVLTSDADPSGTNPILQNILQRIRMFKGEWFLDTNSGFPWLQQVLVKNPNLGDIDALLQNMIMGTPGVTSLTSFSTKLDKATRVLYLSFEAITTSGTVSYNGNLNPTVGI